MLQNIISVISIYTVLISIFFLFLRKIFEYIPISNKVVLNRLYVKYVVCLIISFFVVLILFRAAPPP